MEQLPNNLLVVSNIDDWEGFKADLNDRYHQEGVGQADLDSSQEKVTLLLDESS